MKRFYFAGLENEELDLPPVEDLDNEELQDEVSTGSAEIANEMYSIKRALETLDATTDVATIVSEGDSELSDREVNLVRATANMAVAGTDMDATEVIPGIESYTTRAKLVKAIEDQQTSVLSRISQGVKNLFDKIRKVGQALLNLFRSELSIIKGLIPKIKKLGNETKTVKVNWQLTVAPDGGKETDVKAIFKNLQTQGALHLAATSTAATYVVDAAKAPADVFSSLFSQKILDKVVSQHYAFGKDIVSAYKMKKFSSTGSTAVYHADAFVSGAVFETSINDADKTVSISADYASIFDFLRAGGSEFDKTSITADVSASELAATLEALYTNGKKVDGEFGRAIVAYFRNGGLLLGQDTGLNFVASLMSKGIREANGFASDVYSTLSCAVTNSTRGLKYLRKLAFAFAG